MVEMLLNVLATTPMPMPPVEGEWGESDAVVYVLLGIGLILTIAVGAIFFFILSRGDRDS